MATLHAAKYPRRSTVYESKCPGTCYGAALHTQSEYIQRLRNSELPAAAAAAAAAAVSDCSINISTMSLLVAAADSSSDAVPESRSSTYSDVTLHPVTWHKHSARRNVLNWSCSSLSDFSWSSVFGLLSVFFIASFILQVLVWVRVNSIVLLVSCLLVCSDLDHIRSENVE